MQKGQVCKMPKKGEGINNVENTGLKNPRFQNRRIKKSKIHVQKKLNIDDAPDPPSSASSSCCSFPIPDYGCGLLNVW